jgi:transcriptional regulator with XRE-family HTH domain
VNFHNYLLVLLLGKLKAELKLQNKTVKDMSDKIGVSRGTIDNWDKEITEPGISKYATMADFFGFTFCELRKLFKK